MAYASGAALPQRAPKRVWRQQWVVVEWGATAVTQFSIRTDQSGLIGLMRHLHHLGFVFLSVACDPEREETAVG